MLGTREHDIAMMYGYDSPEFAEYMKEHDNPGLSNFIDEIGQGIKNAWYDLTGQTEKTSYYQAQVEREDQLIAEQQEREDTAYQRQVADMKAAGLSMYGASGGGAASSAGGSSAVRSGSDSISKIAAMIDMKKAMAEIGNVQANTNKTNAEAAATTAGVERDDNYYALAASKQEAEIGRIELENELTKSQTAQVAAQTISIVDANIRSQEAHFYDLIGKNVDNQLKYKELGVFDEKHEADMAVKRTSAYLNQMRAGETYEHQLYYQQGRELIVKQMEHISSQIASEVAERMHLSNQDQLLIEDYVYRQLQVKELQYNYDYSVNHGLRTSDPVSRIGGINFDQFVSAIDGLADWTSGFKFKSSKPRSGGYAW